MGILLSEHIDKKGKKNKKKDTDKKNNKEEEKENDNAEGEEENNEKTDNDDKKDENETFTPLPEWMNWKPGCVITIDGLSATKCSREALLHVISLELKTTLDELKDKKTLYVDYSMGQEHGAIRFKDPCDDIAMLANKLKSGEIKIKGEAVKNAYILDGDEEKKYWDTFLEFKKKQWQHKREEKRKRS